VVAVNVLLGVNQGFTSVTGPLSDRWGRMGLIATGIWVQSKVLFPTALTHSFGLWLFTSVPLRVGTTMVYPTLIAAVPDAPSWRARALSAYRFWRDLGSAIGAH
jgi:MFS family permease